MDTLTPNNGSKSSSSGSSATSSSMDLKCNHGNGKQQRQRSDQKLSRSRSFLHLLSKHLGRHFQHHHHHNDTVYSSQDDIRSSSTDSFSLSYERGNECHGLNGGSSCDLGEERTSRASSASPTSRYSPGMEYYDGNTHIYVQTQVFRPSNAMDHQRLQQFDDSSSGEDGDAEEGLGTDENENMENQIKVEQQSRSASAASAIKSSGGLHLSRISISSSVNRMLHFSSSATASLRSLSCSSTPLRQLKAQRASNVSSKKSPLTPNNSSGSNSSSNDGNSSSGSASSAGKSSKKEKKQQSILRPPVQYVNMKGMSGLYSRVPSYSVCCPYTMHHMY